MTVQKIKLGPYYLYRDAKSPYWQVRAEAAPKDPLWKSTGTENETLARRKAKEFYGDWIGDKFEALKPGQEILFKDLWRSYEEDQATYQKPATMRRISSVGELHLLPAFGNRFLTEIKGLWSQFVRKEKLKRPGSTLFNERKYILAALKWAHENSFVDSVPHIPTIPKDKSPVRVLKDADVKKLFAMVEKNISKSEGNERQSWLELRLFMGMGFYMGMRAGEIAQARLADIDLGQRFLRIPKTKTGRERSIGISEIVMKDLRQQMALAEKAGSPFLYPQVHNPNAHKDQRKMDMFWQEVKREAKVVCRFHDMRHTCANRLKKSDVPPAVAAAYLGMSLRVYDRTYGALDREDTKAAAGIVRLE